MKVIKLSGYVDITIREVAREEKIIDAYDQERTMFIGKGEPVCLPQIKTGDLPKRPCDGEFYGSSSSAWIITDEEAEAYIALNAQRAKAAEQSKLEEKLKWNKSIVERAEMQQEIPSPEDARRTERGYNDRYNEGGYGYVPHIIDSEEYAKAKAKIKELERMLEK